MYLQKMLASLVILTLCGCASVRPLSQNDSHQELAGIYGLLEKSPSGYIFREYSDLPQKGKTWVKLENFQPTWSMGKYSCIKYGLLAVENPKKPSSEAFKCKDKDTSQKFFYARKHVDYTTLSGALIAGLTVSTGGLFAVLAIPSTDYFDTQLYEQAVQQAWSNSVEEKGGMRYMLVEKARIQQAAVERQQAAEAQELTSVAARREEMREEQVRRESMGRLILLQGVGTQVCNKDRNRLIRIGYVERIENNKIKVTVSGAHYENSSLRPSSFQPGVVWDSPDNWYICSNR